jgi:hypothetical protein
VGLNFFRIGKKILELNHIESVEPYDEYNSPDLKIIMRSSKKHIITYGSHEERDKALDELWKRLSGLSDK